MKLERGELIRNRALVDGRWIGAQSGQVFAVENPADGSRVAEVPDCGAAEAELAADAAVRAFPVWRALLAKERAEHLLNWFALMKKHQEDLARLISLEQGKPLAESRGEVAYGAAYIEWFAGEAQRGYGDVIPENAHGRKIVVLKEPVGVVAAITPWNFPIAMLARKMAPALAAGCTVVAKPAEDTPLSALAMAALAMEAGLPAGTVNVVTASRGQAAKVAGAWLKDARVRKLSFTGSTAVGKELARGSAETLKRVSMELGGNAPFVVFDDADLDAAVKGVLVSKYRNSGQTCVCANRILVQAGVYEAFAAKLVDAVSKLRVGQAEEESAAEIGPLINQRAVEKVERHIRDAVEHGARVLLGGHGHGLGRYFFEPTVLGEVTPAMAITHEETFGPVAPLYRFESEAMAIALANATPFGLVAYFYSRDLGRVWRVAEALEVGMVGVNEGIISTEVAPFGGVKESGYGREGSLYGMAEYQQTKYVCMGGLG